MSIIGTIGVLILWGIKMFKRSILLIALLLNATGAQSATVLANASAGADTNFTPQDLVQDYKTEDSLVSPSLTSTATAVSGATTTSSEAFVNSDTGVMRATSTASGNRGDGLGVGGTVASVSISETYWVMGFGTITASNKIDGNWSLSRVNLQPTLPDPDPFWQVQADIVIGVARDALCLGTACSGSLNTSDSGSITDYILSTSQNFGSSSGAFVTVTASLFTQILTADGLIDFGNTAKMFVDFGTGLTATPADPDFLSDPAFFDDPVAPVPLPPTLIFVVSGIGLLGLFGFTGRYHWRRL